MSYQFLSDQTLRQIKMLQEKTFPIAFPTHMVSRSTTLESRGKPRTGGFTLIPQKSRKKRMDNSTMALHKIKQQATQNPNINSKIQQISGVYRLVAACLPPPADKEQWHLELGKGVAANGRGARGSHLLTDGVCCLGERNEKAGAGAATPVTRRLVESASWGPATPPISGFGGVGAGACCISSGRVGAAPAALGPVDSGAAPAASGRRSGGWRLLQADGRSEGPARQRLQLWLRWTGQ